MNKEISQKNDSWVEVINLLSDLVVFDNTDFNKFLKELIKVVLKLVQVDSCLIYFYDHEKKQAILIGSKTPHDKLYDHISLKEGEGITGWVIQHHETVAIEKEAYKDPRFKTFAELEEDNYEGFLSVPISNSNGVMGVINLQNRQPYSFSKSQIEIIEAIVKIISSAFENIIWKRKVLKLEDKLKERQLIEEAKGILMKVKNLDEAEAYNFLRKEAMNKRKTMREIADAVILILK
jgi:uroporphyrinogen-III synthase